MKSRQQDTKLKPAMQKKLDALLSNLKDGVCFFYSKAVKFKSENYVALILADTSTNWFYQEHIKKGPQKRLNSADIISFIDRCTGGRRGTRVYITYTHSMVYHSKELKAWQFANGIRFESFYLKDYDDCNLAKHMYECMYRPPLDPQKHYDPALVDAKAAGALPTFGAVVEALLAPLLALQVPPASQLELKPKWKVQSSSDFEGTTERTT